MRKMIIVFFVLSFKNINAQEPYIKIVDSVVYLDCSCFQCFPKFEAEIQPLRNDTNFFLHNLTELLMPILPDDTLEGFFYLIEDSKGHNIGINKKIEPVDIFLSNEKNSKRKGSDFTAKVYKLNLVDSIFRINLFLYLPWQVQQQKGEFNFKVVYLYKAKWNLQQLETSWVKLHVTDNCIYEWKKESKKRLGIINRLFWILYPPKFKDKVSYKRLGLYYNIP